MRVSSFALRTFSWILVTSMCGIFVACSDDDDDPADSNDMSTEENQETDDETNDSEKETEDTDSEDDGDNDTEADLSEPRVGGFDLKLVAPELDVEGFTTLNGKVWDAPYPENTIWNKVEEEDGCVLYVPESPFCDPPCADGVCTANDVCTSYPTAKYVGKATFTGLKTADGAKEIVVEPFSDANSYQIAVPLLYPAFEEGDAIRVETSGGDYKSFSIETVGISAMKIAGTDEIPMESEQPLVIEWTPPADGSHSRVVIDVDISHHGGAKGKIECDMPDTGTATISASLVTQLIVFGYSGFPSVDVTRIARGYVMLKHGRVELNVISVETRGLAIPGLVSCGQAGEQDNCPEGQICQQDLKCN